MNTFQRRSIWWAVLFCLTAIVLCPAGAAAQSPAPAPAPGSAPASPPGTAPAEASEIREQSIYIPYEKLREVFEREGRGVFLPYDRFMALWKAARDADAPAMPDGRRMVKLSYVGITELKVDTGRGEPWLYIKHPDGRLAISSEAMESYSAFQRMLTSLELRVTMARGAARQTT